MYALVLACLILAFAIIQSLIGGVKLVYGLPAYVAFGVAGLFTVFPAWRNAVTSSPRRLCIAAALALAGYICARSLLSPVAYLARHDRFMVLGALLVYLITAVHLTSARHRMVLVWAFFAVATVHLLVGLFQFQNGQYMLFPWMVRPDYGVRASGLYICPNHLAGLLEMLAMIGASVCVWGRGRLWVRLVAAYSACACLAGVAISGSRGGYFSVLAGLISFVILSGWLTRMIRHRQFFVFLLIAVASFTLIVGGGLFLMLKSPWLAMRVGQMYDPTNMRIYLWQAALKQFALQPLVGTGSGTYDYWGRHFRSEQVQADPVHVHNDYLELLAEYGVAGAVLMAAFLAVHFHSAFRGLLRVVRARLRPSGRKSSNEVALLIGALSALVALLCHSVIDFNLHIPANTLLVAFLFGILANPTEALGRSEAAPVIPAWLRFAPVLLGAVLVAAAAPFLRAEYDGERARVALRDQHYPEALAFAKSAVQLDKANPDAHFYLGEAQHFLALASKDSREQALLFGAATAAYQDGLLAFPQDLRLKLKLGRTLDMIGRFDVADRFLREALQDDPNFGNVYAFYGFHMHLQHHWKKAAAFYRKAQDLQEEEISSVGLKDLERDRKLAAEGDIFPFAVAEDDDEDDDQPVPPPLPH